MLQCIRPAPRGRQGADCHTMGIFAQVADRNCPASCCKGQIVPPRFVLEFAQPDHGIESKTFQPPLLPSDPFGPGRLRHAQIGKQWAFVEIGSGGERIAATLPDQSLEPSHIAGNAPPGRQRHLLLVAVKHVLAQHSAQPEQGLAQVLPCLGIEMRAPQQGCQLLARLRLGGGAGQVGEQAGELLAGRSTGPSRPVSSKRPAGKPILRRRSVVHSLAPCG